ncbi:homeodomain-interacting protein kinase 2 [Amia ocellicauda]|uniref:homeodomain-interacting protein kinase 2 n=1 Tax=Amia ocellicauda TaxID=2972642 RepID=UPI0034646754
MSRRQCALPAGHIFQIRYIVEMQGLPAENLLSAGTKTGEFFKRDLADSLWRLKIPEEHEGETGIQSKEQWLYMSSGFDGMALLHMQMDQEGNNFLAELTDRMQFISLLKRMLKMDPDDRITPIQVQNHPFVTLTHVFEFLPSTYVMSCAQDMEVCYSRVNTNAAPSMTSNSQLNAAPNQAQQLVAAEGNEGHRRQSDMTTANIAQAQAADGYLYNPPRPGTMGRARLTTRARRNIPPAPGTMGRAHHVGHESAFEMLLLSHRASWCIFSLNK